MEEKNNNQTENQLNENEVAIEETVLEEVELDNEPEEKTPADEASSGMKLEEVDLGDEDEVRTTADLTPVNAAMSLLEVESIINRFLGDMEKLKEMMKSQKEMYNASFENDAEYATKNEEMKKLKKEVAAIKQRIVKQPEVVVINKKINELKEETKDAQEALMGYLEQYKEVSGTNQFMTEEGEVIEIVNVLKLVRKGGRG